MNQLSTEKRAQMFACIAEGNSLRSTSRLCDVSLTTAIKFLVDMGRACHAYQDATLRNLTPMFLQLDEIHSFVGVKERLATAEQKAQGMGDAWTWTAIDAQSKLICTWHVGDRDTSSAVAFLSDLKSRVASSPQITTDGHSAYLEAMSATFGNEISYGRLVKQYGNAPSPIFPGSIVTRCIGAIKHLETGRPNPAHVSTSFVERQNLTIRMGNRRFTRLTNAFSKKLENHKLALAITFMHYNFCRIHLTLRVTPAMQAGIASHVMEHSEVVALLDKKTVEKAA